MFKMEMKTGGAAFWCDDEQTEFDAHEVARILRKIAEQVESGYDENSIHDLCGNNVGKWELDI